MPEQKWQKTLRSDMMSPEESCSDDVYVKPVPCWDQEMKTPQAHRQRMVRKVSTNRPIPDGLPKWATIKHLTLPFLCVTSPRFFRDSFAFRVW